MEPNPKADFEAKDERYLVLPSGKVSISESAHQIFSAMVSSKTIFYRGGGLVEVVTEKGVERLELLKPEGFRSRAENFGNLMAWRSGANREDVLKPSKMSQDDAKAIMAASEAREVLPPISSVLRCPVILEGPDGQPKILSKGYHEDRGGLLITTGEMPSEVLLNEAVKGLHWIMEQFDFHSEGDRSRALAALLTPALRLGGFIKGNVPIDVGEADQSQAGKGYRHELTRALYNEQSYFITTRNGGVGSTDESFSAALVAGRPFICLDNFRGKLDSQNLEAFLTCPDLFPARIPHKGEILVDPKHFILQMTSNGFYTTEDFANRASICRIRKRPGFRYRDTLAVVAANQSWYLGCVFSVIRAWIMAGKPRTRETRHDFREWSPVLDWIVQKLLGCAPLMDGHQETQKRMANPALSWLREVALCLQQQGRLGDALIASEIVDLCQTADIRIPGLDHCDEDKTKRHVGTLMSRVFRAGTTVELDGFLITKSEQEYRKPSGDKDTKYCYTFAKVAPPTQPPCTTQQP